MTLLILRRKQYYISIIYRGGGAKMNTLTQKTKQDHLLKKQRLDREFSWISREFKDMLTSSDVKLDNVELYTALFLGFAQ